MLTILVFAAVVLPILLVPTVLIAAGYLYWKHDPERHERMAREKTEMLYKLVRPPTVEIDRNLLRDFGDASEEVRAEFHDIGMKLYRLEGAGSVPPIPSICDSIEGACYRDALNKIGGTTAEREHEILRAISRLMAICYNDRPATKETVLRLVGFVESNKYSLREIHSYLSWLFPRG